MAPRVTKPKGSEEIDPLKPKTEKAKVEKVKVEKPKAEKIKVEKAPKVKTEKADKPKPEKKPAEKKPVEKKDKGDKDGKEKVKAVTGDEAIKVMLEYLKSTNRPYSATEISANLHGKVTKTVADKLLKEMEQNQQIMGKASSAAVKGSQWVFWTIQDPADAASPEDLLAMDENINTLRNTIPALKSTLKAATQKLNTIKSAPTSSELESIIQNLRTENEKKKEKLKMFKDGTIKQISKEEVVRIDKDWKYWTAKRRARKIAFEEIEAQLMSGMSKEDIWEKAGLEEVDF